MRFQLYLAPMLATFVMAVPKMSEAEIGMVDANDAHKKVEERAAAVSKRNTPWVKRAYPDGYYEHHAYISNNQCEEREDDGECDDKE